MSMTIRTYTELSKLKTFKERYDYLKLSGSVGKDTFGHNRWLNQVFYKSKEWKKVRDEVIARDNGCDLGVDGYEINYEPIYIHHMNPITKSDILDLTEYLTNPEYLISCRLKTHNAIHYGSEIVDNSEPIERTKNDTCPWKHD